MLVSPKALVMAKAKTLYVCQSCAFKSPKWLGKCPECETWNGFAEERIQKSSSPRRQSTPECTPQPLVSLAEGDPNEEKRITLGISELDRVLGGGLVPGSVILLGGNPGIGKSTIILQTLNQLAKKGLRTLYVSAEESAQQIRMRAKRLKAHHENLFVYTETCIETVLKQLQNQHHQNQDFQILCLDSVQALYSENLEAAAGSISQVRQITALGIEQAKTQNCITFLIGHVTKEGALAGPRVLEHMVDTVLYFEAHQGHPYRILRTTKNRYGSTNEIGVFEMSQQGLIEVTNPSEYFLSERLNSLDEEASGSVITVTLEGTRPLLVEIQSLTLPCHGGPPRRTCLGADTNRVSLLAAVIQRELNLGLSDQDLYVNVAGGLKLNEPSADLGLIASMASSRLQKGISPDTAFFGEVGLTGEVRAIQHPDLRIQEAKKLGFKSCVLPKANLNRLQKEQKNFPGVTFKRNCAYSRNKTLFSTSNQTKTSPITRSKR